MVKAAKKSDDNKKNANVGTVSVITRTSNPKVVVQSEKVANHETEITRSYTSQILKSLCAIIMCIIILITFFISIKTYNMVNELYHSVLVP